MPLYEYRCPDGHTIDHLHRASMGPRPDALLCAEHGLNATLLVSLIAPGKVTGSDNPLRPPGDWSDAERVAKHAPPPLANFTYVCQQKDCRHEFDEINDFTIGEKPETPRPCPRCGEPSPMGINMPHEDGTLRMYPYFDRGLGRVLESPQHRRQVCKEMGVIPVDGDWDNQRANSERMRPYKEAEEYCNKLRDEMKHSPAWAAYRKVADRENGGKPLDDYLASKSAPLPETA